MRWIPAHLRPQPGTHSQRRPHPLPASALSLLLIALGALAFATACSAPSGPGAIAAGTPTPTPTTAQRIAALATKAGAGLAQPIQTAYSPQDGAVHVSAKMGWPPDVPTGQERVKTLCFRVQHALWTSGVPLRDVSILVVGPVIDDFGDTTTDTYGVVDLTAAAAARLDWPTLTADTAWDRYGSAWLRPSYRPFQLWGAPQPTSTPAAP